MIFIDFLKQVKTSNKKVFLFIVVVFSIYIENLVIEMNNISYIQLSPFTGYAMYSGKVKDKTAYPYYQLKINDGEKINLWKLTQQNKQILQQSMSYMRQYIENGNHDKNFVFLQTKLSNYDPKYKHLLDNYANNSIDFPHFKLWYKRYIEQTLGRKIFSYKTQIIQLTFNNKNKLVCRDTIPLIEYKWKK